MLDIKFIRENPEIVKENIKKKFQDHKLPLVDEVIELDAQLRATIQQAQDLRTARNQLSKKVGMLMVSPRRTPPSWLKQKQLRKTFARTQTCWHSWKSGKAS